MKATELRIGNWLHSNLTNIDFTLDIQTLSIMITYGNENGGRVWIAPIPLTEEWLVKFGFQKFEEYDFGISLNKVPRFEKGSVSIMLSDGKFWYATRQYDGGTSDPYQPVIEVVYVHRLQNLYFELENEELPI